LTTPGVEPVLVLGLHDLQCGVTEEHAKWRVLGGNDLEQRCRRGDQVFRLRGEAIAVLMKVRPVTVLR
jgi:hypothetical protein